MRTSSWLDPGSAVWGPFGALPLSLRTRLLVWGGLAAVYTVDVVLALTGSSITRAEDLPQLGAEYLLIGLIVQHPPLGVAAYAAAFTVGAPLWDLSQVYITFAGAAVLLGTCARWGLLAVSASLFIVWLALAAGVVGDGQPDIVPQLAFSTAFGLGVGLVLRWLTSRLHSALRLAEERREELARTRADERHRLAMELHDVVGHGLTVIAMQAAMLQTVDSPERRAESETAIADAARQSLADLRTMLGALRGTGPDAEPDHGPVGAPVPVEDLLDHCRARLAEAGFHPEVRGDVAGQVSGSALLTLQRLLQEATTNILKHAAVGGRVEVELRHDEHETRLLVRNPIPARPRTEPTPHSGHGLAGMDERVRILGGRISHGPEDGSWVLDVTLPSQERTAQV